MDEEQPPEDPPARVEESDEFALTTEQEAALVLDHNVAITAGAGTGKTTALTERYREILRDNPALGPRQILTLTFTNDATNDMRDRIREMIDDELRGADSEAYGRWRQAKDELEDGYIHTIHGFCSRILREFAVEAGVHPDFETLDEGDAGALIEEAITVVLDRYGLGDDSAVETGRFAQPDGNSRFDAEMDWNLKDELTTLTRLYSRSSLESALESLFEERPDSVDWADQWVDRTAEAYVAYCADFIDVSIGREEADALIETDSAQTAIDELLRLDDRELSVPPDDTGMEVLEELTDFLADTGAHTPDGQTTDRQRFLLMVADAVTTGSGSLQSQTWRYAGSKGTWNEHDHGEARAALKDALETLTEVIDPESRNLDHDPAVAHNGAEQAIALARCFQAVRAEYRRMKNRRNAFDYSDLIGEAIALLEEHEQARRTLRDQFAYIMVDEVQDTDPRQWKLVKLLSGDDPDHFDGRNVFLVGDEKQSIYRFRDADVTQFRDARATLIDDNPDGVKGDLELTGNFRTVDPTLTVINELFEEILQPAARSDGDDNEHGETAKNDPGEPSSTSSDENDSTDISGRYEPFEAEPQWLDTRRQEGTAIEGSVEYLIVPDDEDADEAFGLDASWFTEDEFVSRAEREAKAVAARLTQLFVGDTEVYDPADEEYGPVQPRHVALLFRSSRRLDAFEREFEAHEIPYTNLAGSGFYDTPEVIPLINLLKVFEDPTADIPLYGVLRSPLFGFADKTIAAARTSNTSLWDCLATAGGELAAAREQISDWRAESGLADGTDVCHWSTLLSQIIDETGYLIGIGADDRPQQAVANVDKFREQLRNWEEGSARSVTGLIDRIAQAREGEADPSEATVPGDIEGVQLRTIHSAKGLEFPIVVIPEITRQFNMRSSISNAHFEVIDGEPVLGMKAPEAGSVFDTTTTATYLHVRSQHRQRERAEQRRVLYVAATRARDHLLLSGTHGVDLDSDTGLTDTGDWKEARQWGDWIQPTLIDEPDLVSRLANHSSLHTTIEEGPYTIRRPTPAVDWAPPAGTESVPTDLEIPAPERAFPRARLSATTFRDRLADVPTAEWPAVLRETDADSARASSTLDARAAIGALDAGTVGTVVHKLCELEPPRSDWPSIIRRCVDDPEVLSESAIQAISDHAEVGLETLQELEAGHAVSSRHTEFPVTLELPAVQITGDIDYLSVTSEGYLIVDYKTSDLERQSLATLTEHYLPQLLAYAGALAQTDSAAEEIEIALVFTGAGVVERRSSSRATIEKVLAWASDTLETES